MHAATTHILLSIAAFPSLKQSTPQITVLSFLHPSPFPKSNSIIMANGGCKGVGCQRIHIHIYPGNADRIAIDLDDPNYNKVRDLRLKNRGEPIPPANTPRSEWDAPIVVYPDEEDYKQICTILGRDL
jgi:hypothetical protein